MKPKIGTGLKAVARMHRAQAAPRPEAGSAAHVARVCRECGEENHHHGRTCARCQTVLPRFAGSAAQQAARTTAEAREIARRAQRRD